MANTINYAEKWSPELIQTLIQGALTSPFISTEVDFLDAKNFHFTSMQVTGFKNHQRNGGWNRGAIAQKDHLFTLTHDRDIELFVDKADIDESNGTANIQNVAESFTRQQAVPEQDALFFSEVASVAKKEGSKDGNTLADYYTATAAADYKAENVFAKLKTALKKGKLRRYRANGSLVAYVTSDIMDALEQSTDFTRSIEMTQVAEGGTGIETRVTSIDGVTIFEVIDDERFYTEFTWNGEDGGFEPKTGASKINVLVASLETVKSVPKIQSIYWFEPGKHTEGDGYLYQERALSGVFVFPNGKDGKIDSIFVDVDTATVE